VVVGRAVVGGTVGAGVVGGAVGATVGVGFEVVGGLEAGVVAGAAVAGASVVVATVVGTSVVEVSGDDVVVALSKASHSGVPSRGTKPSESSSSDPKASPHRGSPGSSLHEMAKTSVEARRIEPIARM